MDEELLKRKKELARKSAMIVERAAAMIIRPSAYSDLERNDIVKSLESMEETFRKISES